MEQLERPQGREAVDLKQVIARTGDLIEQLLRAMLLGSVIILLLHSLLFGLWS